MKATYKGQTIAEANRDELIYIEGNWYFPPESVDMSKLNASDTPYTCPWKGECQYYNIDDSKDVAWSYPKPYESAIQKVKKDFSNYVAFWRDVEISE